MFPSLWYFIRAQLVSQKSTQRETSFKWEIRKVVPDMTELLVLTMYVREYHNQLVN